MFSDTTQFKWILFALLDEKTITGRGAHVTRRIGKAQIKSMFTLIVGIGYVVGVFIGVIALCLAAKD